MTNPYAFLERYPQWTPTSVYPDPDKPGKLKKVTVDRAGRHVDATDPANWMTRADALAAGQPHHSFVLARAPGAESAVICFDFDNCFDADRQPSQLLRDVMAQLGSNVLWETSVSGRGVHGWCWGRVPVHRKKNVPLSIEAYSDLRHIVIGTYWFGSMEQPCEGIATVLARYFPPPAPGAVGESGPVPEWRGSTDDDDLLRRARAATSTSDVGFGGSQGGVTFVDLWDGNEDAFRRKWPADNAYGYDRSSVDSALATRLSFWTGKDAARIERLMRQSALVREKWDNRDDYLADTVSNACEFNPSVCVDKPSAVEERQAVQHLAAPVGAPRADNTEPARHVPAPAVIAGRSFATREDQLKLFAGCVYVVDQHRVLTPDGRLLRPEQFRALHGGYSFMMGGPKGKTTNSAWEAFTENQDIAFPRVQSTCFRPDLPFGTVEDGRVNTFVAPNVRMVPGDATPFLNHLRKLLPREDDALILLSYLAACVQYPGKKFQWAPVLQGVEGNGKTFFSTVAAYAVGERFVHWPKASKLVKQFNAWMVGKMLYCVEDIYLPNVGGDVVMEELKPMVTGGRGLEIEGKGVDQYSADICGNFIINTNHKDGLRKSANDRRYAMLYCAQQDQYDLKRDFGDAGGYMRALYEWLDLADGKAICAHYLATFEIPEKFDPTRGAPRAPITSSTDEAVAEGLGMVEQLVMEAIEEGKAGFRGGWVSTTFLKVLLEASGKDRYITPAKRKTLMKTLGFIPHPGMHYGRVHNVVQPDNAQPVLFVRIGSAQEMPGAAPAEIAKAYSAAQSTA